MKRGLKRLMRLASRSSASLTLSTSVTSTSATRSMTLPDAMDLAGPRRLLLPVAPDAVAQALGLADVQDVAPGVLHQVHAGAVRESLERRFEVGGHPPMLGQGGGPCGRPLPLLGLRSPRAPRRSSRKLPAARPSIAAVTVWHQPASDRCRAPRSSGRRRRSADSDAGPAAARRDRRAGVAGRALTPSTARRTLTGRVRPAVGRERAAVRADGLAPGGARGVRRPRTSRSRRTWSEALLPLSSVAVQVTVRRSGPKVGRWPACSRRPGADRRCRSLSVRHRRGRRQRGRPS